MMRAAILLFILAALLIGASWNATEVIRAWIAILESDTGRSAYASVLLVLGIAAAIAALVALSRRAYRQVEQDFPGHAEQPQPQQQSRFVWADPDDEDEIGGIGAADRETFRRSNERI